VNLLDIDPGADMPEIVRLIVEIPKGTANKYEYDKELHVFKLDRVLYSPMHYPGDYGFIPGTLAGDNDPMDVLALTNAPTFTGCLYEVRPVGVLNLKDRNETDQKILAVPKGDPRYAEIHTIDQVFPHVRREIEHFFLIYKELQGVTTESSGWEGPADARRVILESRKAYLEKQAAAPGELS
jgi:inorganic pyrophosphatase